MDRWKKPMRSAGRWNSLGRLALCVPALLFCTASGAAAADAPAARADSQPGAAVKIRVAAGRQVRTATLEDNASAAAFRTLLARGPLTIRMQDYGGFEKVGPLGTEIVRSDEDTAISPGDIILYQGDKVTIYYGASRWRLTRLGRIDGATAENMRDFLRGESPEVTFAPAE